MKVPITRAAVATLRETIEVEACICTLTCIDMDINTLKRICHISTFGTRFPRVVCNKIHTNENV